MLMVVMVHVIGVYHSTFDFESGAFQKYHFLSRIIRVEAGIFIMLTGLAFFYNYVDKEWNLRSLIDYYRKRVVFILVPYLLWAIIYEFYAHYTIDRPLEFWEVVQRILRGESYYQLHFIYIIVQFYLVLPVFLWLTRRFSFIRKHLWLIGIVLQLSYIVLTDIFNIDIYNFFMGMIAYFLLGGWIGVHYSAESRKATNFMPTVLLGIIALSAGSLLFYLHYYGYTLQEIPVEAVLYSSLNLVYLVTGCYFFFKFAEKVTSKLSGNSINKLKSVAVYSFGFYLIHPLILKEVAQFTIIRSNYWFHFDIAVRYLVTVFLCYLVIHLSHRFLPFANLLFGKLPRRKKAQSS